MRESFAPFVLLSFICLSAAQFAAYPSCAQPILNSNFPATCLSLSLTAQNTCLCQKADTYGAALVKAVYQSCGCSDMEQTNQLAAAYCNQVGVDIGPAFGVFVQDNTNCGNGGGSSASAGSGSPTNTGVSGGTSTVALGSSNTGASGSTVTLIEQASGTGSAKSSGAKSALVVERFLELVIGVTGGMLAF